MGKRANMIAGSAQGQLEERNLSYRLLAPASFPPAPVLLPITAVAGGAVSPGRRAAESVRSDSMYVVSVTIFVQPEHIESFIEATLDNARNTRREAGNVRFDFLQCEENASRFLLYEAYQAKDDFAQHQQTEHYLRWKQKVADWMAQPRQGVKHRSLFFGDA